MADLTLTYEKLINGITLGEIITVISKGIIRDFKVDSFEKREITNVGGTTGYTYVKLSKQP